MDLEKTLRKIEALAEHEAQQMLARADKVIKCCKYASRHTGIELSSPRVTF